MISVRVFDRPEFATIRITPQPHPHYNQPHPLPHPPPTPTFPGWDTSRVE